MSIVSKGCTDECALKIRKQVVRQVGEQDVGQLTGKAVLAASLQAKRTFVRAKLLHFCTTAVIIGGDEEFLEGKERLLT